MSSPTQAGGCDTRQAREHESGRGPSVHGRARGLAAGGVADEWLLRARLKGPCLDEYESNQNQPDLNATAAFNPSGDTATIDKIMRMVSNIIMSVHHPALFRRTSDSA